MGQDISKKKIVDHTKAIEASAPIPAMQHIP